jgi:hypothetical protein
MDIENDPESEVIHGEEETVFNVEHRIRLDTGEYKWALVKSCISLEAAFMTKARHSEYHPDTRFRVVECKTVETSWIREVKEH